MPADNAGSDSESEEHPEEDCPGCKKPVGDSCYICDICLFKIHKKCANLSPSEIRCMPLQNRRLTLICISCKKNLSTSKELYDLVSLMRNEILELKTEINELRATVSTSYATLGGVQTYADVTTYTNRLNGAKSTQNVPNIIIKPKKQQSSDITKQDVTKCVNPSKLQIGVRKIQSTRTGNIMIKCNDVSDTRKLKKYAEETLKDNYEIEETKLKNPQVKIVGFNQDMTKNDIEQSIKNQNSFYCNELFKITYIKKNKNNTKTLYAECDATLFAKLMSRKKVYIEWERYQVYENISPLQCFNCWGFYHKNSNCENETACSYCGREHPRRDCPLVQSEQGKKCKNCELANLRYRTGYDVSHEASDVDCPTYKYHIQVMRSKINYEQSLQRNV